MMRNVFDLFVLGRDKWCSSVVHAGEAQVEKGACVKALFKGNDRRD